MINDNSRKIVSMDDLDKIPSNSLEEKEKQGSKHTEENIVIQDQAM